MGLTTTTNDAKLRRQGLVVLPTNPYVRASNVFVPTGFLIWPILMVFFVCRFWPIFLPKLEWNLHSWEENCLEILRHFFCGKMRFAPKLGST